MNLIAREHRIACSVSKTHNNLESLPKSTLKDVHRSQLMALPPNQEDVDRRRSNLQASTSQKRSEEIFPLDLEDDEEKAVVRRKTQALMDILMAGQDVEAAIQKNSHEIDEQMISILDKRTKMASRMREGTSALGGLALVKRRLQAELENKRATPAQRLLNGLLDIMQPDPDISVEEQEEEVARLLRYAFSPPQMPHIDIFETAARLSRGEEVPDLMPEDDGHVPQHVFVSETQQVVLQAAENLRDLDRTVKRGNLGKYEAAYTHALRTRQEALQRVRIILDVAKQM